MFETMQTLIATTRVQGWNNNNAVEMLIWCPQNFIPCMGQWSVSLDLAHANWYCSIVVLETRINGHVMKNAYLSQEYVTHSE